MVAAWPACTVALNERGKAFKDSKMLILGVAYKRDIDDVRESPALDVIGLPALTATGAAPDGRT